MRGTVRGGERRGLIEAGGGCVAMPARACGRGADRIVVDGRREGAGRFCNVEDGSAQPGAIKRGEDGTDDCPHPFSGVFTISRSGPERRAGARRGATVLALLKWLGR